MAESTQQSRSPGESSQHGAIEPLGSASSTKWLRQKITAEFLSDAHLGSGSGGGGIDALIARDRHDRPVIWASHLEGVLRDAARRIFGQDQADALFGRAGGNWSRGDRQRIVLTSLYTSERSDTHIWRSTARESFENRAPKEDSLRVFEYLPRGSKLAGEVELPEALLPQLKRLLAEVDSLGSGRATGSGRVRLSLVDADTPKRSVGGTSGRLRLVLRSRDPICVAATAVPGNILPTMAFIPGRTVAGALAAWLISAGDRALASKLLNESVAVSDALPLPEHAAISALPSMDVLPAPLALQSRKPSNPVAAAPWWSRSALSIERVNAQLPSAAKLKRPEDDLFVFRLNADSPWQTFQPARRIRLRNGRADPSKPDPSLFAVEQIAEQTCFLVDISAETALLQQLVVQLEPVLSGQRWIRIGRGGAPVEVALTEWVPTGTAIQAATQTAIQNAESSTAILTLTSDLLVRDAFLRWRTELDSAALNMLIDAEVNVSKPFQDHAMVHGFNGTSGLWRMPAAAIRRGSTFVVTGPGLHKLRQRYVDGAWLGERTQEGFGRFRLDQALPGVSAETSSKSATQSVLSDAPEEAIAAITQAWFKAHSGLAKSDSGTNRKPSLSQWQDLVADLQRNTDNAINQRLHPTTAGGKSWADQDAKAVLQKLDALAAKRAEHAEMFVRWLRASMRSRK